MTTDKRYCAIVDAYSTGNQLAALLKNYNYQIVHVQSTESVIDIFVSSFRETDFIANIIHKGDLDETSYQLSRFPIEFIITGAESGVELSDQLSNRLKLPGNDISLVQARRDKFQMTEALRKNNLRTVDYIKADNLQAIQDWAANHGKWPIVLKPTNSAGSDNVMFCHNPQEISNAFDTIHGKFNRLQLKNDNVLVQSYLCGQEYIVDSVSWNGGHLISEIWKVQKKIMDSGNIAYDLETLEERTGEKQNKIVNYVDQVLTALGINYGAAHTELCYTEEGPILIETGARLHGGISCPAIFEGLGYNHPMLTAEAYGNNERFMNRFSSPEYQINKYVYVVTFISLHHGTLVNYGKIKELKKLPSFHSVISLTPIGSRVEKTIDLFSSPGIIYMVHKDKKVLDWDYQQIREWEKDGMFTLSH